MTDPAGGSTTFIVRVSRDQAGRLTGVVERVRTGEKERFQDIEGMGRVIARMVPPGREDVTSSIPPACPKEE